MKKSSKKIISWSKKLSNGNVVKFFGYHRSFGDNRVVQVGLCIGKSRRECNDWYLKDRAKTPSLGVGNLEALRFGLDCLRRLESIIEKGTIIEVFWTDSKRESAYRYLERFGYKMNYLDENIYGYLKTI